MAVRMGTVLIVALLAVVQVQAEEPAVSEANLRAEVAREYSVKELDKRKAALKKLENTHELASWQMAAHALNSEPSEDMKLFALQVLCTGKDVDGSLAHVVASVLAGEHSRELGVKMAPIVVNQPFKTEILTELVDLITKLRYPDMPTNWNNSQNSGGPGGAGGGGGGGAGVRAGGTNLAQRQKAVNEQRAQLVEVLNAINKLSGSTFRPQKDSPEEVKKWWVGKRGDFVQADADLGAKSRTVETLKLVPANGANAAAADPKDKKNAE